MIFFWPDADTWNRIIFPVKKNFNFVVSILNKTQAQKFSETETTTFETEIITGPDKWYASNNVTLTKYDLLGPTEQRDKPK